MARCQSLLLCKMQTPDLKLPCQLVMLVQSYFSAMHRIDLLKECFQLSGTHARLAHMKQLKACIKQAVDGSCFMQNSCRR